MKSIINLNNPDSWDEQLFIPRLPESFTGSRRNDCKQAKCDGIPCEKCLLFHEHDEAYNEYMATLQTQNTGTESAALAVSLDIEQSADIFVNTELTLHIYRSSEGYVVDAYPSTCGDDLDGRIKSIQYWDDEIEDAIDELAGDNENKENN